MLNVCLQVCLRRGGPFRQRRASAMSYSGRASAGCSARQLPTQMLQQEAPHPAALDTGVMPL